MFRICDPFGPPLEEFSSREFKVKHLKTPTDRTSAERRNELSSLANTSTLLVILVSSK